MAYKYSLKYTFDKDSPMIRALLEHLKTFLLWKDAKPMVVDHKAYNEFVASGEVPPPVSYWKVEEEGIGVLVPVSYLKYTVTWDKITIAMGDFQDGWRACEKHLGK